MYYIDYLDDIIMDNNNDGIIIHNSASITRKVLLCDPYRQYSNHIPRILSLFIEELIRNLVRYNESYKNHSENSIIGVLP